jgi:hypothetical protein
MLTIQFSPKEELILPRSLGLALGLREGERVDVQPRDGFLWFRRLPAKLAARPLTDLANIITTSLPVGSVDIEMTMDKHGYEQIDGRATL